ncbi:MAG TPA: hypothetical protein VMP11_01880 [Verrucomicrobiae bacterium]|nr:hypothetical protein [Verrucomicrobiae bacterium]
MAPGSGNRTNREHTLSDDPFDERYDVEKFYRRMAAEQNLPLAIIAGSIAALAGSTLWALVSLTTGWRFGIIAIFVGTLVGWAVRYFGKGVTLAFPVAGAVLAVLGCALGELLSACAAYSFMHETEAVTVFLHLLSRPQAALRTLFLIAGPLDGLFYIVAVCAAAKLSFRPVVFNED